ncbi:MAG: tRNA pseudouridine(55) synthase TruB [Clostridia bacterium]|nr:tRNA pseudouridine(55) synthase TruB [Clostridia bacterium]
MANGILIVNKPSLWTSQDVVAKLRGALHEKRIGHGGTLDPMATGVLPVFVGRATRGVEFFEAAEKEYIAGIRLGITTDTEDTTGNILTQTPVNVTKEALEQVLQGFLGEISQIPPMYSAIKIGGQKLYELARKGQSVERKPRKITIFELELLDGEADSWHIRVRCSKGTYVRTLCKDIGDKLGCGGCMESLVRTKAGIYTLEEAVDLSEYLSRSEEERLNALRGVDTMFSNRPRVTAGEKQEKLIRNGANYKADCADGEYRVYNEQGDFLMLGFCKNGQMKTVKSFFEVEK